MSGRSSRQKGMRGEYEVRDILKGVVDRVYAEESKVFEEAGIGSLIPPEIKRCIGQSRFGSVESQSGSDIDGIEWAAIEVKRQENDRQFGQWWAQCEGAAQPRGNLPRREPVLIWRKNFGYWEVRWYAQVFVCLQDGVPQTVRSLVDTNLPIFLKYFEARVRSELKSDILQGRKRPEVRRSAPVEPPPTPLATSLDQTAGSAPRPWEPIRYSDPDVRVRKPWE